jgi:hypothetical protein
MGQYYKFIILANEKHNNREVILVVVNPHDFMMGAKLMEHSYINESLLILVEYLISKNSRFYKSRIVWAGDYADEEKDNIDENSSESVNLYRLADNYSSYKGEYINTNYKYIVNHTKKLYVDKTRSKSIHPLPLLISEGNGLGGGDYDGNNYDLCGKWARDVISMEETIPDNYNELICDFYEY